MSLTIQNCNPERFAKIQELAQQNREYFADAIESKEVKIRLQNLMDAVNQCAQDMLHLLKELEGASSLSAQIEKMIAPKVSEVANRIFEEISQAREGAGHYTSIADRRNAYPKLYALYLEHKPREAIKEITWQEQALAIEQELVHHDPKPLSALLQEIATFTKGTGFNQERKVYLSYSWPSFDLAHEQWTYPFLEMLTRDIQQAGLLVSSKQTDTPFPCSESSTVLLFGTQSLRKDYDERDSALLIEMEAMLKMQDDKKDNFDFPVLPILLSGETAKSFPPEFQFDGVCDLVGEIRKSYPMFLKGLLEDLYNVPAAKESPNRIEWEKAWSTFWSAVEPNQLYFLKKGLDKSAVEYYLEKNQLIQKTAEERQQQDSIRAIDLMDREGGSNIQYTQYLRQKALQKVQVPRELERFVGRHTELEEIYSHTLGSDLAHKAGIVVLHGRGGVGKSELAIKFARENQDAFSLIYHIKAGAENLIQQAYEELAAILDLYIEKDPHDVIVEKVHRRLEEGLDRPWLLIFDNVTEPLPIPMHGGAVIATSQKKNLWTKFQEAIEIKVFGHNEALALFDNPKNAKESYKKLFARLEGLPLLLNQAYRFIQDGVSVDEYLELIEEEHPLWEKVDGYPQALAQTYQLTLKRIQEESQEAYDFLKVCAYLQPDQIHKEHLAIWLQQHEKASLRTNIKIRTLLTDWSLFEQDRDHFKVHRLLQHVLRRIHESDEKELFQQAVDVVDEGLEEYDHEYPETWSSGKIAVSHIDFFLSQEMWEECIPLVQQADLLNKVGIYHASVGKYQRALVSAKTALNILLEMYGEQDLDVCSLYNHIGVVFQHMGDYEQAIEYHQKALEGQLEVLEETHPDLALSYDNLGSAHADMGNNADALDWKQKALEIKLEVFGLMHPYTATSYGNLGITYGDMGNYSEALDCQQKALEIRLKLFGEQYPCVGLSYDNLGIVYGQMGNYLKALEFQQKALKVRLEIFGKKQSDVGVSYDNLGGAYGSLGDYSNALKFQEKALEIFREVLGENHPNVAAAYYNLGVTYGKLGDYEKALECHKKALEIRLYLWSEKHPDVASSYDNLGIGNRAIGDHALAIEYHQKALEIRLELFGDDHPDVAFSYNSLGVFCQAMGDHAKGLEHYEKALKIFREMLGETHPDVASIYYNIGMIYLGLNNHKNALEYHQKALKVRLDALGEEHPETASSYASLGLIYHTMKDYAKALESYQKSLEIRLEILSEKDFHLASSYNNVGTVFLIMENHKKSLEYHQKAFGIFQELFIDNTAIFMQMFQGTIVAYDQLAEKLIVSSAYEGALSIYFGTLSLIQEFFQEKHPAIAEKHYNIGTIYNKMGDSTKALEYFEEALVILGRSSQKDLSLEIEILSKAASIHSSLESHQEALQCSNKALKYSLSALGKTHDFTASCYGNSGWYLANLGRYKEGRQYCEKAVQIYRSNYGDEYKQHSYWVFDTQALIAHKLCFYAEALDFAQQAVQFVVEKYGEKGEQTAEYYNRLASIELDMGKPSGLEHAQTALEISLEYFGEEHVHTAKAYSLCGLFRVKSGNREGLKDLEKAVAVSEKLERVHQIELAESLYAMGLAYVFLDDMGKAMEKYQEALVVQQKAYPKHPDTASTTHSIGFLYEKEGEHGQALGFYEDALAIRLEALVEGHAVAASHHAIGHVLVHLAHYDEGLSHYQKAIVSACSLYTEEYPTLLHYLEDLFHALDKTNNAELKERVIAAIQPECTQVLGEQHPLIKQMSRAVKNQEKCVVM